MMNVLAFSLVLTTLVTASVFSPSPQKHNPREDDVIVKEGHRVVVVEYEKDDKNTRVSISPQEIDGQPTNLKDKLSEKVEDAKEQINEEEIQHRFSPRELVCDAYGKCKHKVTSAIGKTKDTLSDKAQEAAEKAAEKVHEAAGKAAETAHLARDKAAETAHLARDKAEEKVREGADKAAEKVHGAADRVYEVEEEAKEAIGNLKDRVTHKSHEAKEYVKDSVYEKASEVRGATEKAKGGAETAKNLQGEIERNGSRIVDATKEKIPDSAKKAQTHFLPLSQLLHPPPFLSIFIFSRPLLSTSLTSRRCYRSLPRRPPHTVHLKPESAYIYTYMAYLQYGKNILHRSSAGGLHHPLFYASQGVRYRKLEVILTTTIDKLGKAGETVKVAPGYFRNHLMPKLLAVPNIDKFAYLISEQRKMYQPKDIEEVKEVSKTEEDRMKEYQSAANRLDSARLNLRRFIIEGKGNELRHPVTKEEILAEVARQLQVHIEPENLQLPAPLPSLGEYELPLRLPKSIPKPQGKVQWTLSIKVRKR